MGEKSNDLQVLTSQKTENRRMRTWLFIHSFCFCLCSQDLLNHLLAPYVHRSQVLRLFPVKNHCFWFKFNCVCIYERSKRFDCQGRLQVVNSILIDEVLLMLSIELESTHHTAEYSSSWHDKYYHLIKQGPFFFLFEFCCFTGNLSLYPGVYMLK